MQILELCLSKLLLPKKKKKKKKKKEPLPHVKYTHSYPKIFIFILFYFLIL